MQNKQTNKQQKNPVSIDQLCGLKLQSQAEGITTTSWSWQFLVRLSSLYVNTQDKLAKRQKFWQQFGWVMVPLPRVCGGRRSCDYVVPLTQALQRSVHNRTSSSASLPSSGHEDFDNQGGGGGDVKCSCLIGFTFNLILPPQVNLGAPWGLYLATLQLKALLNLAPQTILALSWHQLLLVGGRLENARFSPTHSPCLTSSGLGIPFTDLIVVLL